MSDIPYEAIIQRIGVIIICVLAIYATWQALIYQYITADEFLIILGAILAAWGIGTIGAGTFRLGEKAGFQKGYTQGLEMALKIKKEKE